MKIGVLENAQVIKVQVPGEMKNSVETREELLSQNLRFYKTQRDVGNKVKIGNENSRQSNTDFEWRELNSGKQKAY